MSESPTSESLITELDELGVAFSAEIAALASEADIRAAQARYLGKKGRVSDALKALGKLDPAARKAVGEVGNRVKSGNAAAVSARLLALADAVRQADLARVVDVTLPGRGARLGTLHPMTQARREMELIFAELGYEVATGPQVESDFHNFEALNIPKDHPSRDMQDTFYLSPLWSGAATETLLRTHTSPVQARTMLRQRPPVKIIAPGAVYRRDDDPTHSPQFMQIEGLLVDRVGKVSMADLKGTLLHFVRRYLGDDLQIRLRPSFFPFTEPSAEVDMSCVFCRGAGTGCRLCKGTGFMEIGGSGMVDPEVFRAVGYDPEEVAGFAFGMGIDRMAMLKYRIDDIKTLYEGDVRVLRQFP